MRPAEPSRTARPICPHRSRARAVRRQISLFKEGVDIGWRGALAAVAAREGEIGFEHALHFLDVFLHGVDFRPSPNKASESLNRVRMVRRSWLTPFSMVVLCSIVFSIRRFISMKA